MDLALYHATGTYTIKINIERLAAHDYFDCMYLLFYSKS